MLESKNRHVIQNTETDNDFRYNNDATVDTPTNDNVENNEQKQQTQRKLQPNKSNQNLRHRLIRNLIHFVFQY